MDAEEKEFVEDDSYILDGQILTEVKVDEMTPIDEEGSENGDDVNMETEELGINDDNEENDEVQEIVDMCYCEFKGHSDCVYSAAIHNLRDGIILTGGGDDKAYIWKYSKADFVLENSVAISEDKDKIESSIELSGHSDTITSVGFNFNGNLALTGSYDGTIRVWNIETGELVQTLEGPEDIEWAEWHHRGNAIVAGSRDGTIWMWLTQNGQCIHVFAGHEGAVNCGKFTNDGKFIISGGEDGTVRVWLPKSGQCKHVFETHFGHSDMVTCIENSLDGDLILTGSADGSMKLFQISGKKLLQTFQHSEIMELTQSEPINTEDQAQSEPMEGEISYSVECVAFSSEEFKFLASGGMDKTLKVWDQMNGNLRCVCQHEDSVVTLKWHSSLPIVISGSLDALVRLWDGRNGACLKELSGHENIITNIEVKCDQETGNDTIVSVSDDHRAKVFIVNIKSLL